METTPTAGNACSPTYVAMHGSAVKVAAGVSVIHPTPKFLVSAECRPMPIVSMSVVAASGVETRTAMKAMEPGTGANKDSAQEPTGSIVAVRCAGVRVIGVVAIGAHRGWAHVNRSGVRRTHSNCHSNAGGVCGRRNHQAKAK